MCLRWKRIGREKPFHISRNLYRRRAPVPLHEHDFAEILWVTEGDVTHLINGHRAAMQRGTLAMVLPADRHQLAGCGNRPYSVVNIAFPVARLRQIGSIFRAEAVSWFERDGAIPRHHQLDATALAVLEGEFDQLAHAPRRPWRLTTFCLNLLRLLGRSPALPTAPEKSLPDWLDDAMRRFTDPGQPGAPMTLQRFQKLCARCPEHVARTMRNCLGTTPTAWVNRHRLDRAARLLEATAQPLLDVAMECGFENAAHFYKLFRARFLTTPAKFRREHRLVV